MANSLKTDISSAVAKVKMGMIEILREKLPHRTDAEIEKISDSFIGNFLRTADLMAIFDEGYHAGKSEEEILDSLSDESQRKYLELAVKVAQLLKTEGGD